MLLSGTDLATPTYILYMPGGAQPYQSPAPVGYTPQQIETAYGINQLYGSIGNGAGETIAIVDAYDDPTIIPDANAFSSQFSLPQFNSPGGPTLTVLNQTGGTALPGTDPAGPGPSDWEQEESLDVEWAHAIAPGANIVLFEANSSNFSDLLTAVATAADYPGVSVVSMSFGSPEAAGETALDNVFTTPAGHQGVTFLASSGDQGSYEPGTMTVSVNYPAASPNVISVGGTSLILNPDNSYNSETAWGNGVNSGTLGGSGGGISQYEPEPAYQESVQSTGFRTVPDVAFDADPNTGVAVYDSYDNGAATPWDQVGGTSLASPSWAGLIAIVNEGRAAKGESSLDGPSQTLPELYFLYQTNPSYFHDITSGSNGAYSAGPGYDEVTGLGSPAANLLCPALIGLSVQNTLSGAVEGQPLNNVAVATFTDPTGGQPVSDYTATITWGDGAVTAGTIVSDGGNTYTVLGSHTYINAGTYSMIVSVENTTYQESGSDLSSVSVADAPLEGFAQVINGQVGSYVSNSLVAIFTDTDPTVRNPSQYSATVEWNEGDGLTGTSSGTIVRLYGNTYEVLASSPFSIAVGGLSTVQVVIRDLDGGATVTVDSVLSVPNNPAVPPYVPLDQSDAGPATSQYVTMDDALTNLLVSEQRFFIALNFGTMAEKQAAFSNLVNAYFVYQAAVFQYDMSLPGS